jgi:hypothetical protein
VTTAPKSPLELLHPEGFARSACVLDTALPAVLQPGSRSTRPYELIIAAAPTRALTTAWARAALTFSSTELAADGVMYLFARCLERRRLRRLVAEQGFSVEIEVAHLPSVKRSAFLVPLESAPMQFALDQLLLLSPWRRRTAQLLLGRSTLRSIALPSIGLVVRRPGSRPCFDWLSEVDAMKSARVLISRTRPASGPGFFVLHRFGEHDYRPATIAKVAPVGQGVLDRELLALESIAQTAATAGAAIPQPMTMATVGSARVLLLKPLSGDLAATHLARSPEEFGPITDAVARWLVAWGTRTAVPLTLDSELLERALLEPARLLAEHIRSGRDYLRSIERLCAAVEGRAILGSSAHNDLTMWNVIVGEGGRIGIVDWETASERSLPLVDFYYAAADAAAAVQSYADRVRAFRAAFATDGEIRRWLSGIERKMNEELQLEPWANLVAFHACWLRHASNEVRREPKTRRGPFVRILETITSQEGDLRRRASDQAR